MEIIAEKTYNTPLIKFDKNKGELEMCGRTILESAEDFYQNIKIWMEEVIKPRQPKLTISLKLEYMNSSSYKCFLDIFTTLSKWYANKEDVKIIWYYEKDDEEMKEAGEEFDEMVELTFVFKEEAKLTF